MKSYLHIATFISVLLREKQIYLILWILHNFSLFKNKSLNRFITDTILNIIYYSSFHKRVKYLPLFSLLRLSSPPSQCHSKWQRVLFKIMSSFIEYPWWWLDISIYAFTQSRKGLIRTIITRNLWWSNWLLNFHSKETALFKSSFIRKRLYTQLNDFRIITKIKKITSDFW